VLVIVEFGIQPLFSDISKVTEWVIEVIRILFFNTAPHKPWIEIYMI